MDTDSVTSTISPSQAERPLVLAFDVGTSSVRASLYDAQGRAVEGAESRTAYEMKTTPDGGVEMDADELFDITCRTIDKLLDRSPDLLNDLCGVGMCTFWHGVLGIDRDGKAITPIYSWNDTRSCADADGLAEQLGVEWIHSRTGAVPHASYFPAKLLWLKRTAPDVYAKAARWVSFGEYFHLKLFGHTFCSVSMASGTGLLNPNTCDWEPEMLRHVGIESDHLSALPRGNEALAGLNKDYAARWPALKNLPWLPAVGDGATSNVGAGCVTKDRVALMVGTSGAMRVCWRAESVHIPRGLWCYRASRDYFVMGGALSNGGDVYSWCQDTLRLEEDETERQLAAMAADGHGLTVLPFFSGERSTGWADHARAAIVGMSLSAQPLDILRALLEAVAYRFAAIYDLLRQEISDNARIVASGGGLLNSPTWTQIMADVIGAPVVASAVPEASSRGAALLALQALGQIDDLENVATPFGAVHQPDPANHERYRRGRERQQRLYDLLIAPGPDALDE